jgi:hypothetical protein
VHDPRGSTPCESSDTDEPGQLVRVSDRVDAGDATVHDDEAHRGVHLTADVEPNRGCPVEPGGCRLEIRRAEAREQEASHPLRTLDWTTEGSDETAAVRDDDDIGSQDVEEALQITMPDGGE